MSTIGRSIGGRLTGRRIAPIAIASGNTPGADDAPQGIVAPASSLDGTVRQLLTGKFAADPGIRFGDGMYYLPTLEEVRTILAASQLERRTWLAERFDCDDFAYVLKGEMSAHAYESNDLRFGLCVGMVWGNFDFVDGYHAVNWFIDAQGVLRLIEPQNDTLYGAEHCLGQISLLLV